MKIYVAQVHYQSAEQTPFTQLVGVFDSTELAQAALLDFTEGTLLQQYPDCTSVDTVITPCDLNQPVIG